MSSSTNDVNRMVGVYKKVFILLFSVTALGVILTYVHMPLWATLSIAFVIIAVKSKIILDAFKHLMTGRQGIVILFVLTGTFFAVVLLLPFLNQQGHLVGTVDISKEVQIQEMHSNSGAKSGH